MARFDVSGSIGRGLGGVEIKSRDIAIRRELEQQANAPAQSMNNEEPPYIPRQISETGLDPLLPAAFQTVDLEARKDKQGNLQVYKLPAGDMGGNFEVAGINDRYHPEAFKRIASLPAERRAEAAAQYIREYTSPLVSKLPSAIQPFAQDLAFNRGMGGATKYLQQGLNSLGVPVAVDGRLGPQTLRAIGTVQPGALMQAASQAQLQDEYARARSNPQRRKFLQGLENRINNRLSLFGSV